MEKDDSNPFKDEPSLVRSEKSSKSNEDSSSEGSSKKKKGGGIFSSFKKDKKDKKKDNKPKESISEGSGDDSKSFSQSEETSSKPFTQGRVGGNRSMSETSTSAVEGARMRLMQDAKSSRSGSVVVTPKVTSPRLGATWNQATLVKPQGTSSPETKSTTMIRERSGSIASGHRVISPRRETIDNLKKSIPTDANPSKKTTKGDGQSAWMNPTHPTIPKPGINTMVDPNRVKDTDPAIMGLRTDVKRLLSNQQSAQPPQPGKTKIIIQENPFSAQPIVTIETQAATENQLPVALPFPELSHIPEKASTALQQTKVADAILDALIPEQSSLLESIMGSQRKTIQDQENTKQLTSLVLDTVITPLDGGNDDTLQSIFDTIDAKYIDLAKQDDNLSDTFEQEILEVNIFMATDGFPEEDSTSSSSSFAASKRPIIADIQHSMSMPVLPQIKEPSEMQKSNSSQQLSPVKGTKLSVARRLSNAGTMPPIPLQHPAFANLSTDEQEEAMNILINEPASPPPMAIVQKQVLPTRVISLHDQVLRKSSQPAVINQVHLQRLVELIQKVHKVSIRRNDKTNAFIQEMGKSFEKLQHHNTVRNQHYEHSQRQFIELLKVVSQTLISIQGPQQSMKSILDQSNTQIRTMFQANLGILQQILQVVMHYQEELKVICAVSNKQAQDHATMMKTFTENMKRHDDVISAIKTKYRTREAHYKEQVDELQIELAKAKTINRGLVEILNSNNKQVTIEFEHDEDDVKRLPPPKASKHHEKKK